MTTFKSLAALMFLVAPITVACMEQDSRNAERIRASRKNNILGTATLWFLLLNPMPLTD